MPYKIHPAAKIFPMQTKKELEMLADNIAANGLRRPVEFFEGKVIDGRNRVAACAIAGVEVVEKKLSAAEVGDPVLYVHSVNLYRKLPSWKMAIVAARMATYPAHRPSKLTSAIAEVKSREEVVAITGVNIGSLDRALRVLNFDKKKGCKKIVDAMDNGEVPIHRLDDLLSKTQSVKKINSLLDKGGEAVLDYLIHGDEEEELEGVKGEELYNDMIASTKSLRTNITKLDKLPAGVYMNSRKLRKSLKEFIVLLLDAAMGGECSYCKGGGCDICVLTGRKKLSRK